MLEALRRLSAFGAGVLLAFLPQCGQGLESRIIVPSNSVNFSNLFNNQILRTGFLAGTSLGYTVGLQFDGGPVQTAIGTMSWSFNLTSATSTWKQGSRHSITLGAILDTVFYPLQTISITKGMNQDINGDGYPDLVVGPYGYNNGAANDGALWINYGNRSGMSSGTASTPTIKGPASSNALFGTSLALGDIDGDGYADLAVGARQYNNGAANDGAVYIYYGSSSGISSQTAVTPTIKGIASGQSKFGYAVALGDINGDGYADLAVGAETYNNGTANDGAVYVFPGGSTRIADQTAGTPTIKGQASGVANFGDSVTIGDLNGDGYPELVVGGPRYNNGFLLDGSVYIFSGSSSGIATQTASTPTIKGKASSGGNYGTFATIGDINGDGYGDLVVSAHYLNGGDGGIYIYNGGSAGVSSGTAGTPTIAGMPGNGSWFGQNVALGDIDRDGYADLAVGAYQYNSADGAAYIYPGSSSGISSSTSSTPTLRGPTSAAQAFGRPVAFCDFNADGFMDLYVPIQGYNNGTSNDGGFYFLPGSSSGIASASLSIPTVKGPASTGKYFGFAVSQ